MIHTNHFIHGWCTGMSTIQRCLSHFWDVTSIHSVFHQQGLLSSSVDKSDIHQTHHNHQWTTHPLPMTHLPPMITKVSLSCGWGCAHQHVILPCHKTIQHPLHHLQSPPWLQTHIHHSWNAATAQQHTEEGCHWMVHVAWWHGGTDDMCKTACLDLQNTWVKHTQECAAENRSINCKTVI